MAKPQLSKSPCVLIVEGYGDLLFYAEALEYVGVDQVYIKEFTGVSILKAEIETFLNAGLLAEKTSIAVIVDADSNASGQIHSISELLKKITGRELEHAVWSNGQPNLGFFVVPDGKQTGEVETLAWNAWANDPSNVESKACIEQYLKCMKAQGHEAHSPDKGKIGALLAVKYDEDPRLGPGARHKVFDFTRPEFQPLLDFLRGFRS